MKPTKISAFLIALAPGPACADGLGGLAGVQVIALLHLAAQGVFPHEVFRFLLHEEPISHERVR